MEIVVKNFLGEHFNIEDAIVLRDELKKGNGKDIVLNFEGIENVPATFFNCLFGDFLYGTARKDIFNKINVLFRFFRYFTIKRLYILFISNNLLNTIHLTML